MMSRMVSDLIFYTLFFFSSLSACIAETRRWCAQNLIKYNDSKTEVMLVYSKHVGVEPAPYLLTVGDADIRPVSTVRSLGVILDSHLTMDAQVRSACKKTFYHLRTISQIRKFLTESALAQLIHAFVISQLATDYSYSPRSPLAPYCISN